MFRQILYLYIQFILVYTQIILVYTQTILVYTQFIFVYTQFIFVYTQFILVYTSIILVYTQFILAHIIAYLTPKFTLVCKGLITEHNSVLAYIGFNFILIYKQSILVQTAVEKRTVRLQHRVKKH